MKKILIVDDEPMMLKLVNKALKDKYDTILASSGEDAVKIFKSESPDMILSDLKMPTMSGYELQTIVQENSKTRIPFIFMTADESDESESKGFDQGAADYIRKPIKADLLLKRIERIFENVDENHRLEKAAQTDAMTGLLNKAASEEQISYLCRNDWGALIIIDLDSFKLVNDIYGHEMGDRILIRFSSLIKSVIRENDIAGRIGGDEFIVFCPHLANEAVIAEKIRLLNEEIIKTAKEYLGEDMDIPLGCSAGAAFVFGSNKHYKAIFEKADTALYRSKQAGKHRFSLYRQEDESSQEIQDSTSNIRMIFGERSLAKGAWVTDRETFSAIYRFLVRFLTNYPWYIRLVVFTLNTSDSDSVSKTTDSFIDLSRQILRGSDVMYKHKSNQVLVLLMKVDNERSGIPINRVLKAWEQDGDKTTEINYKIVTLDGSEESENDSLPSLEIPTLNSCESEIKKLPAWMLDKPEIDVSEGLGNSGSAEDYLMSMDIFLSSISDNADLIDGYLEAGDIKNYTIKVHGLKSTSRVIGATELSKKAAALEKAGNDNDLDFIKKEHVSFMRDYRYFLNFVTSHDTEDGKEKLTDEMMQDACMTLMEYAQTEDYTSAEITLDQINSYSLDAKDRDFFSGLRESMFKLDWENMTKTLTERISLWKEA